MAERARQRMICTRQALKEELIISGGEGLLMTQAKKAVLMQKPMDLLRNLKDGAVSVVTVLEAFQAKVGEWLQYTMLREPFVTKQNVSIGTIASKINVTPNVFTWLFRSLTPFWP